MPDGPELNPVSVPARNSGGRTPPDRSAAASSASALLRLTHFNRGLVVVTALVLCIGLYVAWQEIRAQAYRSAASMATAVAASVTAAMDGLDLALFGARDDGDLAPLQSPEQLPRLALELTNRASALPELQAFFVADATGRVLASRVRESEAAIGVSPTTVATSLRGATPELIAAGRAFVLHEETADDHVFFTVGRPLLDGSGRLLGVAAASVDVSYLRNSLRELDLGSEVVLWLLFSDGHVLLHHPEEASLLEGGAGFAAALQDARGTMELRLTDEAGARYAAFHKLDLPISVVVAQGRGELRHRWLVAGLVLAALWLALAVALTRSTLRLRRAARQKEPADRHLAEAELARTESLQATARQLSQMNALSLRIASLRGVEEILRLLADEARHIVGAHLASANLARTGSGPVLQATSLSDKYAAWRRFSAPTDGSGIYRLVSESNQPLRLTQAELERHPAWRGFGAHAAEHPPLRGWLCAPLVGHDGGNLGIVQVADRLDGDFSESDEAILVQIAQMAAGAIESAVLLQDVERAHAGLLEAQREARLTSWTWQAEADRLDFSPTAGAVLEHAELPTSMSLGDFVALLHEEDRDGVERRLRAIVAEQHPAVLECRTHGRDGSLRHLWMKARPATDARGRPTGVTGTLQDITERRVAEERFRTYVTAAVDAIVTFDAAGIIIDANPAAAALVRGKTLRGHSLAELADDEEGRSDLARLLAAARLRNRLRSEIRLGEADGRVRHLDFNTVRLSQREFLSIIRDVTAEREAEADVAHQAEQLQGVLSAVPEAIVTLDPVGSIVAINAATLAVFGYSEQELLGEHFERLVPGGVAGPSGERIGRRRDGTELPIHLELDEVLLPGRSGAAPERRLVGTIRDLTGEKRMLEQLQQMQKMEAVGQLTGGIAHDFNNLLGIVIGNLDMLRLRAGDDRRAVERIDDALRAALRGSDLTKKLLGLAQRRQPDRRIVDPNAVLADMRDLLDKSLTRKIAVQYRLAAGAWSVELGEGELEDMILNLGLNARDALPDGGTVTVSTANVTLDEQAAAENPAARPGDYLVVSMTDDGCGMPPETLRRAFEPFFTTKPRGKGTGLGLSMVYSYARAAGGFVLLDSEPGRGTQVGIHLPRVRRAAAESSPDAPSQLRQGRGEHILIVDDEALLQRITAERLTEIGYRVTRARSGPEALRILAQGADVDLLLTDLVMPGMDGLELLRQARALRPDLVALAMSGFADLTPERNRALRELAGFIAKPFRIEALSTQLRALLDGKDQFGS